MSHDEANVKKVPPYPIDVEIPWEGKIAVMKILKLTERGAIVDTKGVILSISATIENTRFIISTTNIVIAGPLKVIKNYDRLLGSHPSEQVVQRLSEMQFLKLTEEQRSEIRRFLVRIKQVVAP